MNDEIIDFKQVKVLHLGMVDEGAWDRFKKQRAQYFQYYHYFFWKRWSLSNKENRFRGEGHKEWISPIKIKGNSISRLQAFLYRHGFMPYAEIDGVYGYRTLAAVRVFQEYVRTVEEFDIGLPDGRVGRITHRHMRRWKKESLYCAWGPSVDPRQPFIYPVPAASEEYLHWLTLLQQTTEEYESRLKRSNPDDLDRDIDLFKLHELSSYPRITDSLPVSRWQFHSNDIHLIGLRIDHDNPSRKRGNDDLFVLLMNGHVFKFWGSTDPKPSRSQNNYVQGYEPYLAEGQHLYRFGWHKLSNLNSVYKALKPDSIGVLVFRDWDKDDALTEADIRVGLKSNPSGIEALNNPNMAINIHWSGNGSNNWSAGCQVISGNSYINHQGKLIDCTPFCAASTSDLSAISRPGVKKTRGAYNFLSDFVLTYAGKRDKVRYTLGRDGTVDLFGDDALIDSLATPDIVMRIREENLKSRQIGRLVEIMAQS